ncbi:MAG: hypothetical protein HQM04_14895 [Magnetococcales bacterium]|nr:hypothetical protein [Magnetococcales bacterium]MBF0116314.1 hypothetical protein [Magnetococcales bacterium]
MTFDHNKIAELKQYYDAAEATLKEGECAQNAISTPAINELRYAGQHLLRYLTGSTEPSLEPDDDDGDDEWENAAKHCKRAMFDAAEAPVQFYMKQIRVFQEDYRKEVVTDVVAGYVKMMVRVDAINQEVSAIAKGSRQKFAEKVRNHVQELADINSQLRVAREELNKKITLRKKQERLVYLGLFLTVVGIIAKFL